MERRLTVEFGPFALEARGTTVSWSLAMLRLSSAVTGDFWSSWI